MIDEFIKNNKNVIIVGGSGLYVKALLYDYKFDVENDNNQYDNLSNEDIYTEIKELNNLASDTIYAGQVLKIPK